MGHMGRIVGFLTVRCKGEYSDSLTEARVQIGGCVPCRVSSPVPPPEGSWGALCSFLGETPEGSLTEEVALGQQLVWPAKLGSSIRLQWQLLDIAQADGHVRVRRQGPQETSEHRTPKIPLILQVS